MHLLDRHLFRLRRNAPRISERIEQSSLAVPIELIGDRNRNLCTCGDRVRDKSINIRYR